ncbi:MAG: hypothetical protein H7281_01080 [Bacteriovorax sp.]|nr:hypothetical protein [Bacteriovorax sp.]
MKILTAIVLALFTVISFAKTKEEKTKEKVDEEYVKDICLMKDKFLRGKKLQECIKDEFEKLQKSKLK